MAAILGLFVLIIVLGFAWWGSTKLLAAFKVPDPWNTVIVVLVVGVGLLIVLQFFGLLGSLNSVRVR